MEKISPLVSVVIPVYNVSEYLPGCIRCLKEQTLKRFEVLFVDDGSADDSYEIITRAAREDSRFKALVQDHQNAGAARNAGIERAVGEYLCFLDADDLYAPDLLQSAVSNLRTANADVVVYDYAEISENGAVSFRCGYRRDWLKNRETVIRGAEEPEKAMLIGGASVWNKMYRTRLIRENGLRFDEIQAYNDVSFVLTACAKAGTISFLEESLYMYRCSRAASISSGRGDRYDLAAQALESFERQTAASGLDKKAAAAVAAHYRIKTLLYDIGDYTAPKAEAYYRDLQVVLRQREIDRTRVASFYPELIRMIGIFEKLDYRVILAAFRIGAIGLLRKKMHRQRERGK